ncbi:hypothetical protein K503DRAFT_565430 [Rhizopogon vinicolor AM-OR11-026]|uniref:DUF6533 domain-containing protein n=1 Tax=Rhizopogon vinicolor AM-OR11-026 TaxID=1314800 RepID=A0A1B7N7U2_9AGAM|nr:hypothetical protein K503DRAFT_565430 [Rhizopogon vinicolor AM-OR11-026]
MVSLHTQQTTKYFRVAPVAVWAFDYCLTFEHEVCLFTSIGRWSIATVMFIIARYSPIVWIISDIYATLAPKSLDTCLSSNRAAGVSLILILLATEGLLLIRTLALWHDSWKIRRFLLAVYLFVIVSMVTCNILAISLLESICVPISTPSSVEEAMRVEHLIMGQFVYSALFELTAIAVTLYHSLRHPISMRAVSKLASTLRRGSLLYALSLLAISVANIVTPSLPLLDGQNGMLDVFQGVLHGVLASRILFELRAQATDRGGELNVEDTYVRSSGLRFASERIPMAPLS